MRLESPPDSHRRSGQNAGQADGPAGAGIGRCSFHARARASRDPGAATDFANDPLNIPVRAGQATRLGLQNNGSVEQHLSPSVLPIADGSVAAMPEAGHDMGPLHSGETLSVHVSAQPGQEAELSLTPTEPMTYPLATAIQGHQEVGTLVATEP